MTRERSGKLRHVLAYQEKAETVSTLGRPAEAWANVITGVRASVEAPTGKELLDAAQMKSLVSHVITTRRAGSSGPFTPAGRFVEGTAVYNVVAVLPSNDGMHNKIYALRSVAPEETA